MPPASPPRGRSFATAANAGAWRPFGLPPTSVSGMLQAALPRPCRAGTLHPRPRQPLSTRWRVAAAARRAAAAAARGSTAAAAAARIAQIVAASGNSDGNSEASQMATRMASAVWEPPSTIYFPMSHVHVCTHEALMSPIYGFMTRESLPDASGQPQQHNIRRINNNTEPALGASTAVRITASRAVQVAAPRTIGMYSHTRLGISRHTTHAILYSIRPGPQPSVLGRWQRQRLRSFFERRQAAPRRVSLLSAF